ncbi:MAG: DUF4142 domain-containing protein [Rhizobacter sp.]|nr:DUF4142 domain-containing protein [Rhizobacter sp.]
MKILRHTLTATATAAAALTATAALAAPPAGQTQSSAATQAQRATTEPANPAVPAMSRDRTLSTLNQTDRNFAARAAQSGLAEVQAARLVTQKSPQGGAARLAQQLIDDHTQANARLKDIARQQNLILPLEPSPDQQMQLRALRQVDGPMLAEQFTQGFGLDAHREAIALFSDELASGRNAALKAFARDVLPKLESHLKMAEGVHADLQSAAGAAGHDRALARRDGMGEHPQMTHELADAQQEIAEAVQVVQRMKRDPEVASLLGQARGVLILTKYGRGAVGLGAQGGEGVLVTQQHDEFGNPVFYNLAGVSLGLQLGGSGGEVAMLLMTDRAIDNFKRGGKFSLHADAGLTIARYSERGLASAGKMKDVVIWSGTKGAFAGAAVGITDLMPDDDANRAYYGRSIEAPAQVFNGTVPNPHNNLLGLVLDA